MRQKTRTIYATAMRLWQRSSDAKLGLISAGVAFFGFLAIFPAAASVIALWGFASDPALVSGQVELLRDFLPADAYDLLNDQVLALIAGNGGTFGTATIVSTLIALWSARAGVDALIQGLDAAYGTSQRTGLWHTLQAVMLTATLICVALVSVIAAVIVPLLLAVLPLGPSSTRWLEIANEVVGISVVVFGLGLAYRFGPNHFGSPGPRILPGLLLATLLWAAASRGFMLYLGNFGSYNQIYGSIGAVVVLMVWFWFSSYAVLLGAALNAVLPRTADQ
jgi:membrane protein